MAEKSTSVASTRYQQLNYAIGTLAAEENAVRPIASRFCVSKSYVAYYKAKVDHPGLHAGTHGGARNFKFQDADVRLLAETTLLTLVLKNGRPRPDAVYASQMQELQYDVGRK